MSKLLTKVGVAAAAAALPLAATAPAVALPIDDSIIQNTAPTLLPGLPDLDVPDLDVPELPTPDLPTPDLPGDVGTDLDLPAPDVPMPDTPAKGELTGTDIADQAADVEEVEEVEEVVDGRMAELQATIQQIQNDFSFLDLLGLPIPTDLFELPQVADQAPLPAPLR